MLVFKFGGASVKSSGGILNLAHIVESYKKEKLAIVISAFGKTTNALETILDLAWKNQSFEQEFQVLKDYHMGIVNELFQQAKDPIRAEIQQEFTMLHEKVLSCQGTDSYDKAYDQIISFGEILSTKIVSAFLNIRGIANTWVDIRENLKTDATFREGVVDWEISDALIKKTFHFKDTGIYIAQGFIGFAEPGVTTTLGREGSILQPPFWPIYWELKK